MDNGVIKAALALVLAATEVLAGSVHGFSVPPGQGGGGTVTQTVGVISWPRQTGVSSAVAGDDGYFAAGCTNIYNPALPNDLCTNNGDGLTATHVLSGLVFPRNVMEMVPDNSAGLHYWGAGGGYVYQYDTNLCPYPAGLTFTDSSVPTWQGYSYKLYMLLSNGVMCVGATLAEELAAEPQYWVECPMAQAFSASPPFYSDWASWADPASAVAFATGLVFAGYSDWRAANINEISVLWRGTLREGWFFPGAMFGTHFLPMCGVASSTRNDGNTGKYMGVGYVSSGGVQTYCVGPKTYDESCPILVRGGKVNAHEGE